MSVPATTLLVAALILLGLHDTQAQDTAPVVTEVLPSQETQLPELQSPLDIFFDSIDPSDTSTDYELSYYRHALRHVTAQKKFFGSLKIRRSDPGFNFYKGYRTFLKKAQSFFNRKVKIQEKDDFTGSDALDTLLLTVDPTETCNGCDVPDTSVDSQKLVASAAFAEIFLESRLLKILIGELLPFVEDDEEVRKLFKGERQFHNRTATWAKNEVQRLEKATGLDLGDLLGLIDGRR